MKAFVLDEDGSPDARKWDQMLPCQFSRIFEDEGAGFLLDGGHRILWEPGIIVAHQPSTEALRVIENIVTSHAFLSALVISGSPQTQESVVLGLYFRKARVEKPIDKSFSHYFEKFWSDLEQSKGQHPNFALLESTAVPAPLLAYAVTVHYQLEIPNIQQLSKAADACYEQIQPFAQSLLSSQEKPPIAFPDVCVPLQKVFASEIPGDAKGIRFRAMRNAIELLREDL